MYDKDYPQQWLCIQVFLEKQVEMQKAMVYI